MKLSSRNKLAFPHNPLHLRPLLALSLPDTAILHSALYTLHSTLYTLHSTLYTLHSTLYTLHSTLCTHQPPSPRTAVHKPPDP